MNPGEDKGRIAGTGNNAPADIVISLDDQPVPVTQGQGEHQQQQQPHSSPPHLRLPDSSADPFANVALPSHQIPTQNPTFSSSSPNDLNNNISPVSRTSTSFSTDTNASISSGEAKPFAPPHLPTSSPFREPTLFRIAGDTTPSIRSEQMGHHTRPYSASIRNEFSMGHHLQLNQHSQHHRNIDAGHHRHHHRDAGKPLVVDYPGLDASVSEAQLLESGFTQPPYLEDKEDKKSLERANSTASSGLFRSPSGSEFRRRSARKASFYSERAPRPPLPESLRYTFYTQATGLIQAASLPKILVNASLQGEPGSEGPKVFSDLLKDGCYWLDILDPSDFDMQILSKHFHIHPLTIEDISTEEIREKYEVFRHYYFVCFRTFDQDYNSGSYLQPASMYSVVLRDGIITFHFRPTNHHLNVLRRIEQLQSHIALTPDWINYALLDDITDSFASPIQTIEYEVDSIDELVLLLRENETTDMLRRIGSCRKNVMAMSRLLANKADVLRGLMKRFDERYAVAPLISSSITAPAPTTASSVLPSDQDPAPPGTSAPTQHQNNANHHHYRDGEMLLYLGDILDHVLTMLQSLSGYDKVLDRSHSNYLAQISLEINQLSNKTNEVVGTLTFFASLIVPMTFISGLWGMNVHVPGQPDMDGQPLYWWWGLIGFMLLYCVVAIAFGKRYGLI
ncbi:CorA metal ion transporter [Mortierella antarctica]|nr:CorA metal ion transporter [Mortierella antarctica]